MLYVIHKGYGAYRGGQTRVIHLVSSVEAAVASGRPWAFTDRHADLWYTEYAENIEKLNIIDWRVMPLRYWRATATKERRQAEFLVHDWFPWSCVLPGQSHQNAVRIIRGSG